MKRVVILGGGSAGLTIAKELEKKSGRMGLDVTLVDIRAQMTYQPFLAEVTSGAIEGRHIQVPLQKHLKKTHVVKAKAKKIDHEKKVVRVSKRGEQWEIPYDELVITLGNVTKTFPVPGIAENAIGIKSTEEAIHIRNKVIDNIVIAASLPRDSEVRKRLLTFVVVGGGFSGVETFAEMVDLGRRLIKVHPEVTSDELRFHLIEATGKILPEIPQEDSQWVVESLERRGGMVHLNTTVQSADGGYIETSTGEEFSTDVIVWAAGTTACPVLRDSTLPLDDYGRLKVLTNLRVGDENGTYEHLWACGDATACQDLSGGGLPDGTCAPTAQHAVRQAKQLAKNLVASVRGKRLHEYVHQNAGCVAGLGSWLGVFVSGKKKLIIRGPLAWLMHRGYHGLAMPTIERKLRIFGDWLGGFFIGRDLTTTIELERPKALFRKFAARPESEARDQVA